MAAAVSVMSIASVTNGRGLTAPRRCRPHLVIAVACQLALAPATVRADGLAAESHPAVPQHAPQLRLALQPCRFPQRFERCLSDCERQRRKIEDIEQCSIDPGGYSTCPERLVALVRECLTACNANYCPQFNP